MRLKGKGINPEALTESIFCIIFGILLFFLTYKGTYLSFVTPRMKPYLYGLSLLMILWAVMNARNILKPRYKSRMYHCLILVIPILILADPPPPPAGSGLIQKYATVSLPGAPSSNGVRRAGGQGAGGQGSGGQGSGGQGQPVSSGGKDQKSQNTQTRQPLQYDAQGRLLQSAEAKSQGQSASGGGSQGQSAPGGGSQGQSVSGGGSQGQSGSGGGSQGGGQGAGASGQSGAQSADPAAGVPDQESDAAAWYTLNGLDPKAKTITISDDDFYTWMFELGVNAKKYNGYTITMKGFIYREADSMKKDEFALVRLSMWCCAADLTPIGLLVDNSGGIGTKFKENDWVLVTGKAELSSSGDLVLKARHIEATKKPEEEYVYPTF